MRTLLEVCHSPVLPSNACTELLKHAFLARLPISPPPIFQHAVELLLRLPPALFNGRNEILLVRMAKVAGDIGVLKRLQWREGGLGVQVCDRVRERGCIDVSLGKQVVPEGQSSVSGARWLQAKHARSTGVC